ncbi:hypothetical protein ACVWWG_002441 [Bradyrhizobium sp. LB7.2]
MAGGKVVDRADRRIDPGIGILLGPQRRGMRQRQLARRRRENRAGFAHEHRFHTGCADVDSEIHAILPVVCCGARAQSRLATTGRFESTCR